MKSFITSGPDCFSGHRLQINKWGKISFEYRENKNCKKHLTLVLKKYLLLRQAQKFIKLGN